ncbi:MAG TPA: hypothetical protein VNZ22_05270 [Bacillota bacterium]|nr:hypothetical protein [Bacillota bacterium]
MSPGQPQTIFSGAADQLQWSITFQPKSQALAVQTRGPLEAASLRALVTGIAAALQQLAQGCPRLLVDHRASELLASPASIFYVPELIGAQFGIPRGRRMAFVFSRLGENERFFENVLNNAGLVAAAFTQMEAAQAWLDALP